MEEWSIKESGGSTISWWAIRVGIILKPLDKDIRGVNIKEHPNAALEIRISHLQLKRAAPTDVIDPEWILLLLGEGISESNIVSWAQCHIIPGNDIAHEYTSEVERTIS